MIVGRQRELEILDRSAVPGALIAVIGPSGVGKTTLAREWVRSRGGRFVECRDRPPVEVANELAGSSSPRELDDDDAWVAAGEHLEESGVELLVLDDVSADFDDFSLLRASWSGCLVTTGHHAVEATDAATIPLRAFEVPDRDALANSALYELFLETGRRVDLSFEVESDEELDALHALAQYLDGYPLALALAARRAAALTTLEVLRLVKRGADPGEPGRAERHRSMDAALALSIDSLSPAALKRLYAITIFRRPVRPEVIATLLNETLEETLEGVQELIQGGFLSRSPYPSPLDLFGRYVRRTFPEEHRDEAVAIEERAEREAVRRAREALESRSDTTEDGEGPSLWRWMVESPRADSLDVAELSSVIRAYSDWLEFPDPASDATLSRMRELLERIDRWASWQAFGEMLRAPKERVVVFERALERASTPVEKHRSLAHLAGARLRTFDFSGTREAIREALEFGAHNVDTLVTAVQLAAFTADEVDPQLVDRARDRFEEELATLPPTENRRRVQLLVWLTQVTPPAEMVSVARRALDAAEELGSPSWIAWAKTGLANNLGSGGRNPDDEALSLIDDAIDYFETVDDRQRLLPALSIRSLTLLRLHRPEEALAGLRAARDVAPELDEATRHLLGASEAACLLASGDLEGARQANKALGESITDVTLAARLRAVCEVALALEGAGDPEPALKKWRSQVPALEPLLRVLIDGASLMDEQISEDVVAVYDSLREVARSVGRDVAYAVALQWLEGARTKGLDRLFHLDARDSDLVVAEDGSAFRAAGHWTSIAGFPRGRDLLAALAAANQPLDFTALGDALYPDETLTYDSLQNRVNVAVSRLRKAGLKPYLAKQPEGFVLEGDVLIES